MMCFIWASINCSETHHEKRPEKVTALLQGNEKIKEEVELKGGEQKGNGYGEWHLRKILSNSSSDMEEGQEDGPIKEERGAMEGWKADKQIMEGLKEWLKEERDFKSYVSLFPEVYCMFLFQTHYLKALEMLAFIHLCK